MVTTKPHELSEGMVDETLAESFPASDPPGWTLGIDSTESAIDPPKGGAHVTRDALLKLLSDSELARVATLEGGPRLAEGEEYIDLARPERGVLRVQAGQALDMGHVLPRVAMRDETWSAIVRKAHRGWQSPDLGRP